MDGFSVLSSLLATPKDGHGGSNSGEYANPKIDELTRQAAVELDEPKRRTMLVEALKVAREDAAYIPIHQQPVAWAMRDNVDLPQFPDEYVRLWFANIK
jgi:peptide/nickel transport system substrate-binding protein